MLRNARASNGFVYFVYWPKAGFTKVGSSSDGKRWRPFLRRGGEMLGVIEPTQIQASVIEWDFHVTLGTAGAPRRFRTSEEAKPYLGGIGRGFTECYVDSNGRDVFAYLIADFRKRADR